LFLTAGDPHAFGRDVELDVDVEVAGILVAVKKCPGPPREVAALTLPQRGELTQTHQQRFEAIKVFRRCMPLASGMTSDVRTTQEPTLAAARAGPRECP